MQHFLLRFQKLFQIDSLRIPVHNQRHVNVLAIVAEPLDSILLDPLVLFLIFGILNH